MAENFVLDLIDNKDSERISDISILLIDHETESVASLTSMLEKFSYKVISANVASKAVSMIEKQKDIRLVIANIEMPHIDSHCFHTSLLHKDIPLILIVRPELNIEKTSNFLTKRVSYFLKKPISERDITNMSHHVLPKKSQGLEKINLATNQEGILNKDKKQVEAFRENLKRQRTSQASLLRRRPFMETFTTSETYQKRRNVADAECKTKPVCPIRIEDKREEENKMENNVGRRRNLWTRERHIKFLSAISILGEKDSHPKSILRIMNDPNLTHRQVSSHLQKYKAQVEQTSETLSRKEHRSTDKTFEYPSDDEYPFKASNLANNLVSDKKPIKERNTKMLKFHLGGKFDLSNHSFFGNLSNKSSMEVDCVPSATSNTPPYNISSTNDVNHTGQASTSLSNNNLPFLSGLPSSVGASNTYSFQMSYIPQPNPNPFQSSSSILETRNQMNLHPTSILDAHIPQADLNHMGESYNVLPDCTMNPFETNMNIIFSETNTNQEGWVPLGESYVPSENMITSMVQEGLMHSETSYAALNSVIQPQTNMTLSQTNINHMGNTYFGESNVLPQDMIFCESNTTHMSLASCGLNNGIYSETNMTILETNINLVNWVSSGESNVLAENMISSEANMIQAGSVLCETTYAAQDSVVPPETNMEDMMSLVQRDEGCDIPIGDMISFDIDVNEMNLQSLLGNYGHSERDIPFFNTPMERRDNVHDDPEFTQWIDNVLNDDV